jgi:hypothetical protein
MIIIIITITIIAIIITTENSHIGHCTHTSECAKVEMGSTQELAI